MGSLTKPQKWGILNADNADQRVCGFGVLARLTSHNLHTCKG